MSSLDTAPAILLVDDDQVSVFACKRALKKLQINGELCVASDGQQALDHLHQSVAQNAGAMPPTVVLLDINMPRMNGIEFVQSVRSNPVFAELKIFAFVTDGLSQFQKAVLDESVAGYLCKDAPLETLATALKPQCDSRQGRLTS